MINTVLLVGRLTKDVELRYSAQGTAMASVTIACQREFKNANGERESDFIQVKAFRKTAELLANHFKKGEVLGVQGRIQTGSYEGQDGKRVYTTDVYVDNIKFIQGNSRNNDGGTANNGGSAYGGQPTYGNQPSYPPQGAATQPQQQYSEAQVQEYLRQQQAQQQQQPAPQTNYQRVDEDPFANSKGPIEVSEDDLPF